MNVGTILFLFFIFFHKEVYFSAKLQFLFF